MTDRDLPDDLARWPTDPYRLLNVAHDVDGRELKRAYAKLIRRFKPDHHPQQFARIRAAFEQILQRTQWLADQGQSGSDLNWRASPAPAEQPPASSPGESTERHESDPEPDARSANSEPDSTLKHRRTDDDQDELLTAAWRSAVQGDPAAGYRTLRDLVQRQSGGTKVYIELYWILRLYPHIDSEFAASHWLLMAVKASRFQGAAWNLYCLELRRQPFQITGKEHFEILNHAPSSRHLLNLLQHRWRAALQHNCWIVIRNDFIQLQSRFYSDPSDTWAQIMLHAADLSAWSADRDAIEIFARCERGLAEQTVFHFQLSNLFDRYDFLIAMRAEQILEQIPDVTNQFASLIRDSWREPLDELRPRLLLMLETWTQNPHATLALLTQIRIASSKALQHIRNVVRRMVPDRTAFASSSRRAVINEVIEAFFFRNLRRPYRDFRLELLDICILNEIEVAEIVRCFENLKASHDHDHWSESPAMRNFLIAVRADAALEVLLLGVFAFWSD